LAFEKDAWNEIAKLSKDAWVADGMAQNDMCIRAMMFYHEWPALVLNPTIDIGDGDTRVREVCAKMADILRSRHPIQPI
jgi:hypothetical protein